MANRPELQNKGTGLHKSPTTGAAQGPGTSHKGISREIKTAKHNEAAERNSRTAPDRTRQFWRDRGFKRQSQAASLVTSTVSDVNEQAKIHKQRAEDWPLVTEDLGLSSERR